MSSNSGVIVNRANETSPFFAAIKSRNSKSLPELYSSEVNTEAAAQSRVEVESSSAVGYSRTMRISLPRYGVLNQVYLHSRFGGSTTSGTAANTTGVNSIPFIGAFAFREVRLVYNGSVLEKFSPFSIISDLWKHADENERHHLVEMLGGLEHDASGALGFSHTANKSLMKNSQRCLNTTASGTTPYKGVQDFYLPLQFWFDAIHSPNRGLDLSVLANEVILEVDVEASSNIWLKIVNSGSETATIPEITNVSAVCYLTEFDQETEKMYRSLTYQPGAAPVTQIGYQSEHVVVANNVSRATAIDIKLNQFVGQVYKLVVYAVLTDAYTTNKNRFRPVSLSEIQLRAVGTNIFNQDNLTDKEAILESYRGKSKFKILGTVKTGNANEYTICNPGHIYELNLKKPMDLSKVSASGSMALGQLSVPSLRVVVEQVADYGSEANIAGGNVDVHVVAYSTALYSYATNTSGSTNIRVITN